jgi:ABC-type branched-subunit amino acid transport system ATPase component
MLLDCRTSSAPLAACAPWTASAANEQGGILGLIGPNGSGKTTLLDDRCGHPAELGQIRFNATSMRGWSPADAARAGIARRSRFRSTRPD